MLADVVTAKCARLLTRNDTATGEPLFRRTRVRSLTVVAAMSTTDAAARYTQKPTQMLAVDTVGASRDDFRVLL